MQTAGIDTTELNALAILVAAVAHFLLGGLWYSPLLFAKPFMRGMGKTAEELQGGASAAKYVLAFLGGLVKSAGLAVLLTWMAKDIGVAEAAGIGAFVGLALHGAADAVNAMFEGRNRTLVAISVAYDTVGLAIAGAILAAMS